MATKTETKPPPQFQRKALRLAETVQHVWRLDAPPRTTREQLEEPATWELLSGSMRPMDRVHVLAPDGSWTAECLIVDCEQGYPTVVVVLWTLDLPRREESRKRFLPSGYEMERDPQSGRYAVRRLADDKLMHPDGFDNAEEARRALLNHATIRGGRVGIW